MTATYPTPLADGAAASTSTGPSTVVKTPWYRRLWVLVTGGVLLLLLSFTGGFAAGSASSLLDGLLGVLSGGDFQGGPGQFPGDGERPELPDGGGPWQGGQPGDQGTQGESGTSDGTNS
ncbi:hypothetical protein SAMN05428970_3859 [Agromyces sp. CF514]|uniref:hypothetical protein n=1 Tax=Agromyces sp. CF514 TaxID=1881031 RepID=UPI0008DF42DD|nr:hypothetical protein [Agromyces sp. CF514]SFR91904.1 hypothetical protein SAMN05428970_3859 [Agromyces sp. CF514]